MDSNSSQRRDFLARAWQYVATSLALSGCGHQEDSPSVRFSADQSDQRPAHVAVRRTPLPVKIHPIATSAISDQQFQTALRAARPPQDLTRIPLGIVLHALRLWGPDAEFPDLVFERSELNSNWGRCMLDILCDDEHFRRISGIDLDHLFEKSEYGVHVRSSLDSGWASQWGSTHVGDYIEVMGECGVPSGTPLRVTGHLGSFTLRDIVVDEARRLHPAVELDWVCGGLARYVESPSWENRFGRRVSFDEVGLALVNRSLGAGVCFGCHVPFALATLINLEPHHEIVSAHVVDAIQNRLREYAAVLGRTQRADGSWSSRWTGAADQPDHYTWGTVELDDFSTTGHHLEWMMYAEPDVRPPAPVLEAAVQYLGRMLPLVGEVVKTDWHAYLPLSHAARALVLSRGEVFGSLRS